MPPDGSQPPLGSAPIPSRIPLAVAATGHRDIDPIHDDAIRQAFADKLRQLQAERPRTPLRCFCGLAEGPDMLFAEAALSLGMEVVAVLAAPPDDFPRNFARPAHPRRSPAELAKRFKGLLARCLDVVVASEGVPLDSPRRYALVGAYLARHCHVLLAAWDGKESSKVGGTRHVLKQFQQGVEDEYLDSPAHALDAPEHRLVHALYVPRGQDRPGQRAFKWTALSSSAVQEQGRILLDTLDRFNEQAVEKLANDPAWVEESRRSLDTQAMPLTPPEARLHGAYRTADALARHWRKTSLRHVRFIFAMALAMIVSFALYSNGIVPSPWLLGTYIACFLAGFAAYVHNRIAKAHSQALDYRGLAEGLRVQLFFRLATVPDKVSVHYLRKQRSEIIWIRDAVRTMDFGPPRHSPAIDLVTTAWIEKQVAYFSQRAAEALRHKTRTDYAALSLFVSGLVVAAAGLFTENTPALLMAIGLLPALAALLAGYSFRTGLDVHAKQYGRMRALFSIAEGNARSEKYREDPGLFQDLVRDLGKEVLAENADWILAHRDRSPTWPQ